MEPLPILPHGHIPATSNITTTTKTGRAFFDRLPLELLVEIFFQIGPLNPWDPQSGENAPILLCRVCKHWRQVATGTPLLWANFAWCPTRYISTPNYMRMVTLFLDLSRHYPLTFHDYETTPVQQRESLPLFLREINRWYDVSIELDAKLCQQFLEAPIGKKPLLKNLSLSITHCSDELSSQLPAVISKFTRLRTLSLVTDSIYVPLLGMPWTQLTAINIEAYLPIDKCVDILNGCSSLMFCTLKLCAPDAPIKAYNIILPSLEYLHLLGKFDAGGLLSRLTCPALTKLYINYKWRVVTRDRSILVDFLSRSSCTLKAFHTNDNGATDDEIISYMMTPALQSVKVLSVKGFGPSTKTLNILKHQDNSTFMPFLEVLTLHVEGVPDNLVSDVVASRFEVAAGSTSGQRSASLKRVEVAFRCRNHEKSTKDKLAIRAEHVDDLFRCEEFCRNGLKFEILVGYQQQISALL